MPFKQDVQVVYSLHARLFRYEYEFIKLNNIMAKYNMLLLESIGRLATNGIGKLSPIENCITVFFFDFNGH